MPLSMCATPVAVDIDGVALSEKDAARAIGLLTRDPPHRTDTGLAFIPDADFKVGAATAIELRQKVARTKPSTLTARIGVRQVSMACFIVAVERRPHVARQGFMVRVRFMGTPQVSA